MPPAIRRALAGAGVFLLCLTATALADPGELDTGFSGDGKAVLQLGSADAPLGALPVVTAFETDGSTAIAEGVNRPKPGSADTGSKVGIRRFEPDGSPDETFSSGTWRFAEIGFDLAPVAIAVDDEDRVVVLVWSHPNLASNDSALHLLRFEPDGTPDSTLAGDGSVQVVDPSGDPTLEGDLAIDSQGRIVIARPNTLGRLEVARFLEDGSPDLAFGSDGVFLGPAGGSRYSKDIALTPDDGVVVGGGGGGGSRQVSVAVLDENGDPDTSFSEDGFVDLSQYVSAPNDNLLGITVDSEGRIVVVGTSGNQLLVVRFRADGFPDGDFSGDGVLRVDPPGATSGGLVEVLTDAEDQIVAAGLRDSQDAEALVARFTEPGALDTTFSGDGFALTDFTAAGDGNDANASSVGITQTGDIMVGGYTIRPGWVDAGLARFTSAGVPSASFDGDGVRLIPVFEAVPASAEVNTLGRDGQGRLLVGGRTNVGSPNVHVFLPYVARILPSGQLDPSYGTDGVSLLDVSSETAPLGGVAVLPGGEAYVQGSRAVGDDIEMYVARIDAEGDLDPTWGTGGLAIVDPTDMPDFAGIDPRSLVVADDGSVFAGSTIFRYDGESDTEFMVSRFDEEGVLDETFGESGHAFQDLLGADVLNDIAVDDAGRPVAIGQTGPAGSNPSYDFGVARFETDGDPDPTFSQDGWTSIDPRPVSPVSVFAQDVAIDSSGKIVVAGQGNPGTRVVRLVENGGLDASFGSGESVFLDDILYGGMTLDVTDRILVGGSDQAFPPPGSHRNMRMARIRENGVRDASFGAGGVASATFPETSGVADLIVDPGGGIFAAGATGESALGATGGDLALVKLQGGDVSRTLQISRSGSGAGAVTSQEGGIDCGADCSESYLAGTPVVLTASPELGSSFAGWSGGGCTGTGQCTLTIEGAATVGANFVIAMPKTKITRTTLNHKKRSAEFRFSATEGVPPLSFECSLDGADFEQCQSPETYKRLSVGRHSFEVQARASDGTVDSTPAQEKFKIKKQ